MVFFFFLFNSQELLICPVPVMFCALQPYRLCRLQFRFVTIDIDALHQNVH